MVRVFLASVATGSVDSSILLGFFFCPSALGLSIDWPHSHLLQTDFLHLVSVVDMEMHGHVPSRRDLLPAAWNAVSQQPPAASSFQVCLSCGEPPHCRSHLSHGGMHLGTKWGWPAVWGPGRMLMGFPYSRAPCQLGWGFVKAASQFLFSLCSTMYICHCVDP